MQCKLFYRDTDVTINAKDDYDVLSLQITSHTNSAAARAWITSELPQLDAIVNLLKSNWGEKNIIGVMQVRLNLEDFESNVK